MGEADVTPLALRVERGRADDDELAAVGRRAVLGAGRADGGGLRAGAASRRPVVAPSREPRRAVAFPALLAVAPRAPGRGPTGAFSRAHARAPPI